MTPAEAIAARVRATNALAEKTLAGLRVPGTKIDPWLFTLVMGAIMARLARTNPKALAAAHKAPLAAWVPMVNHQLDEWAQTSPTPAKAPPVGAGVPVVPDAVMVRPLDFPRLPAAEDAGALAPVAKPEAPVVSGLGTGEAPQGGGSAPPTVGAPSPLAIIPSPPPGLPERFRESWIEARTRAGQYCRGLGNIAEAHAAEVTQEAWDKEQIVEEADPDRRARRLREIREATSKAIAEGRTPEWLASELGNVTGEWSRNWLRVARTELQAANNEGVAVEAYRNYGALARVARVPEPSACVDCQRLFLDEDGKPRIFGVQELVANGTNVGKKREDWVATLYVVHPNCSCLTMEVPPGMAFNDGWRLVRAGVDSGRTRLPWLFGTRACTVPAN